MARNDELGSSWWARRWIRGLESIGWQSRLARGRSYTRTGRIFELEIVPGTIRAQAGDAGLGPFRVTVSVRPFPDQTWDRLIDLLAGQAIHVAKLLAGELPTQIAELWEAEGAWLFPEDERDIGVSCSCPEWTSPCKHAAAVLYAVAAEIDRDPLLLLRSRGRTRDELTSALRARWGGGLSAASEPEPASDPITADPRRFWRPGADLGQIAVDVRPPDVPGSVLARLGRPPFAPDPDQFMTTLRALYARASASVRELALDEPDEPGS